jgi:multiple sugar transport system substrate-binding protein
VVPYYSQVSEILQRRLNAALAGKLSPGEALGAAQREIRDVQSRYD